MQNEKQNEIEKCWEEKGAVEELDSLSADLGRRLLWLERDATNKRDERIGRLHGVLESIKHFRKLVADGFIGSVDVRNFISRVRDGLLINRKNVQKI